MNYRKKNQVHYVQFKYLSIVHTCIIFFSESKRRREGFAGGDGKRKPRKFNTTDIVLLNIS